MDIHFYITFVERIYRDSLTCVDLPTIYPGCTYFWLVIYISALLFLTIICFYVIWNLYKQVVMQREYERLMKSRPMSAVSEVMHAYTIWDTRTHLNSIAEADLAERIRKIHARAN